MASLRIRASLQQAEHGGEVAGGGGANQRGAAAIFDRAGQPLGPILGWQDQRTAARCVELLEEGFSSAATKAAIPCQIARVGSMMTLFFQANSFPDGPRRVTGWKTASKSSPPRQ